MTFLCDDTCLYMYSPFVWLYIHFKWAVYLYGSFFILEVVFYGSYCERSYVR